MKKTVLRLLPFIALLLVGCDNATSASEFVPIDPRSSSETSQSTPTETSSDNSSQDTSSEESSSQEGSSSQQGQSSEASSESSSESSEESYNTDVPTEVAQITITGIKGYNDTWLEVKYDNNPFDIDHRLFSYLKVNNKSVLAIDYKNLVAAKYFNVQVENNNLETYTFDFYDSADNKYATGSGTNSTYDPGSGSGSTDGYETNEQGQYIIPLTINNRYGDGYLGIAYTGDPFEIDDHKFDHFMVDGEAVTWSEWEPLKASKYFNIKVSDNTKASYKVDFYDSTGIYATGTAA